MADSQNEKSYLDIHELIARTRLSRATIWRLKKAGKIPFYQPGGKGGRVKFPANAIESARLSVEPGPAVADDTRPPERLPGPRPKWMSSHQHNKSKQ